MRIILGLFTVGVFFILLGCTHDYTPTPLCEIAPPPSPKQYLAGNTDERLVLMGRSYVQALQKANDCNTTITKVNLKNKALLQ